MVQDRNEIGDGDRLTVGRLLANRVEFHDPWGNRSPEAADDLANAD